MERGDLWVLVVAGGYRRHSLGGDAVGCHLEEVDEAWDVGVRGNAIPLSLRRRLSDDAWGGEGGERELRGER